MCMYNYMRSESAVSIAMRGRHDILLCMIMVVNGK